MSSRAIVAPRPLPRCTTQPDQPFWSQRDIFKEIQGMARRGAIAVTPVQDDVKEFTGFSDFPAGWRAFGFRVPAKEQIHIRLRHPNEGWFRLSMVGKWGTVEEGMLRNLIPTGNPEVKFVNPSGKTRVVYVIVDDPGWMSNQKSPFSMTVARSWDPAVKKVDDSQIVTGIWAQKKEDAKPSVEPAKPQVSSVVSKG